jgi:hypothetical protein
MIAILKVFKSDELLDRAFWQHLNHGTALQLHFNTGGNLQSQVAVT